MRGNRRPLAAVVSSAMRRPLALFALVPVIALALAACTLPGCAQRASRLAAPIVDPAPVADSPAGAVRRLEWIWANRDTLHPLDELLTEDFRFVFAAGDSAGNPYRDAPWGTFDEALVVRHMFSGYGDLPPIDQITLRFDPNLIAFPDIRPGKDNPAHRTIWTGVDLRVDAGDRGKFEVRGNALFYLVRGDSVLIPPEAIARGLRPDSTRWWIQRWEDETLSEGARALPTRNPTWGQLKALFR